MTLLWYGGEKGSQHFLYNSLGGNSEKSRKDKRSEIQHFLSALKREKFLPLLSSRHQAGILTHQT